VHDASSESDGGGRVRSADRPPPFACRPGGRPNGRPRSGWREVVLASTLVLSAPFAGCRPRPSQEAVSPPPVRPLSDVLAAHTPELMKLPGVVGTAESRLGDGRACILVMVVRLTPELGRRVPRTIEGWPVRIDETGEIHAMPDSGQ